MPSHPRNLYAQELTNMQNFNVLKCIAKYCIEQESHPAKELLPHRKIKFDKLRTHLNEEAGIKQKPCLHVIGPIKSLPLRDFVYIIGDLNKGLNFHHSFFLAGNF